MKNKYNLSKTQINNLEDIFNLILNYENEDYLDLTGEQKLSEKQLSELDDKFDCAIERLNNIINKINTLE